MPLSELFALATALAAGVYIICHVDSLLELLKVGLIFITGGHSYPVQTHSTSYQLIEKDKEYIKRSQEVLKEVLGDNPVDTLMNMEAEERIEATDILVQSLAKLYEVEDIKLEWFFEDYFQDESAVCGYYNESEHTINLNKMSILTDDRFLVRDFLDTIFHEFRHVVQWQNVIKEASYGTWYLGKEMTNRFGKGLLYYIPSQTDPEGYFNQFVEVDAREIAMYILEGIC